MDTPKKPQASDDEVVPTPPAPAPSLQARSPFRPLSLRRRQQQPAEPPSVVQRPATSPVFDASPTTIAAALAGTGTSPAQPIRLSWAQEADATGPAGGDSDARPDTDPAPPPDPD